MPYIKSIGASPRIDNYLFYTSLYRHGVGMGDEVRIDDEVGMSL